MPRVEIEAKDVKERTADSKGRVAIGPQYAGKTVEVAVVDADDDE